MEDFDAEVVKETACQVSVRTTFSERTSEHLFYRSNKSVLAFRPEGIRD